MTLGVIIKHSDGIVVASDQAARNTATGEITTHGIEKIIKLSRSSAIFIYGTASINGTSAVSLVKKYKNNFYDDNEDLTKGFIQFLRDCHERYNRSPETELKLLAEQYMGEIFQDINKLPNDDISIEASLAITRIFKKYSLLENRREMEDELRTDRPAHIFDKSFWDFADQEIIKLLPMDWGFLQKYDHKIDKERLFEGFHAYLQSYPRKSPVKLVFCYLYKSKYWVIREVLIDSLLPGNVLRHWHLKPKTLNQSSPCVLHTYAIDDDVLSFVTGVHPQITKKITSLLSEVRVNALRQTAGGDVLYRSALANGLSKIEIIGGLDEKESMLIDYNKLLIGTLKDHAINEYESFCRKLTEWTIDELENLAAKLIELTVTRRNMEKGKLAAVAGEAAVISLN